MAIQLKLRSPSKNDDREGMDGLYQTHCNLLAARDIALLEGPDPEDVEAIIAFQGAADSSALLDNPRGTLGVQAPLRLRTHLRLLPGSHQVSSYG